MPDIADILASLPLEAREALLDGPAHTPPDGIMPNFESPPNQNSLVIGIATTGFILVTLLFFSRFCARVFCLRKVHIEDGLVLAGYGTFVAYAWCFYHILDKPGLFVHQWDIRLRDLSQFTWIIYLGTNFHGATLLSLKPAVLLEWSRTFVPHGTRNVFWWICHILLVINVLFYASMKIASNISCQPHSKIWDKTVQGTCLNERVIWMAYSCLNLVSDVVILILPQKVIWRLKLSRAKKIAVSILFAFGLLTCVAATLRIATNLRYLNSPDQTFTISAVSLCCWAEMVFLFVVVCVPSVPKVAKSLGATRAFTTLRTWTRLNHRDTQIYPHPSVPEKASYEQDDDSLMKSLGGEPNIDYFRRPNEHGTSAAEIGRLTHIVAVSEEHNLSTAAFECRLQGPGDTYDHSRADKEGRINEKSITSMSQNYHTHLV
ncbi:hypothetical protein F4808DRAFT_25099 [Astrocystis sublimbata]|nr:hypothetical protein F4808DRAFT_25099 [Astrocystis sublimbata]